MKAKFSVDRIITNHLNTFYNFADKDKKRNYSTILPLFLIPLIFSITLVYFGILAIASSLLLEILFSTFIIFSGFLILLLNNMSNEEDEKSIEKQIKQKKRLIQETFSNIFFEDLISFFGLISIFLLSIFALDYFIVAFISIFVYYFAFLFIFNFPMIMKRINALVLG